MGDVNGDGIQDVLYGSYDEDALFLGDAAGGFVDASDGLPTVDEYTYECALEDVDGDGDLDAVLFQLSGWRIYGNDGTGTFPGENRWLSRHGVGIRTRSRFGDVDGDNDVDLLTQAHWGQPLLLLNDGSGVFSAAPFVTASGNGTGAVLADLDGDGDLDAYLVRKGVKNVLALGDGTGAFVDASVNLPPDSGDDWNAEAADVDGDGDVDVVVGREGGPMALYLNDGSAVFVDASTQLPMDDSYAGDFLLVDIDGDGDVDIVTGEPDPNGLYENDGTGAFSSRPSAVFSDFSLYNGDAVAHDVDGDGDPDIVAAGLSTLGVRLALNDGTGAFTDVSRALPMDGTWGSALGTGDFDGDGDVDVFVGSGRWIQDGHYASGDGDENALLLNDGGGSFVDASGQLPPSALDTRDVGVGDVDGDADLDLYVANVGPNQLLLGDGAGSFTDGTGGLSDAGHSATLSLSLADLDGDGDLDALRGEWGARMERGEWSGRVRGVGHAGRVRPGDGTGRRGRRRGRRSGRVLRRGPAVRPALPQRWSGYVHPPADGVAADRQEPAGGRLRRLRPRRGPGPLRREQPSLGGLPG